MHYGTYPILAGTPAKFREALEKRGHGGRMVEMRPGDDRNY
jgi:hypothetical protein